MIVDSDLIEDPQTKSDEMIVYDDQKVGQRLQNETYEITQPNQDGFFVDTANSAACSVRVALRVRPLISKEMHEKQIVKAQKETSTVTIDQGRSHSDGEERMFTFDASFPQDCRQEDIFNKCVKNLVLGCFQGFNATVLAYGQTGSGKTWTMGSGYTSGLTEEDYGIIPRVIRLIFEEVEKRKKRAEFIVKCSFLEIYNEELIDLLDQNGLNRALASGERNNKINIREEKNGSISVYGLHEEKVECVEEMAACLDRGSNFRTTSATLMNANSSRSHAIFTISIEQHQIDDLYQSADQAQQNEKIAVTNQPQQDEFMVAKFHFVDLAGSERAKKTGAVGSVLKEGININKSLLVLGNVIQALTEEGKKNHHVPYRDSKLTRILQDSLGGNSRTSMIACVSPAESNFDETLNTLKYANRARQIKNKPKVNRDPNSALIAELRQQCYEIQKECLKFKNLLVSNKIEFQANIELPSDEEMAQREQALASSGVMALTNIGSTAVNPGIFGNVPSGSEIRALEDEIKLLKIDKISKEKQIQNLQAINEGHERQINDIKIDNYSLQEQKDFIRLELDQINTILQQQNIKDFVYTELIRVYRSEEGSIEEAKDNQNLYGLKEKTLLQEYQQQVKQLKEDLESNIQQVSQLQRDCESFLKQAEADQQVMEKQSSEIQKLKQNQAKLLKENVQLQNENRNTAKGVQKGQKQQGRGTSEDFGNKINIKSNKMTTSKQQVDYVSNQIYQMNSLSATDRANKLTFDIEENLKSFNDRFMENLTKNLAQSLFDISNEANEKRKLTVGSSFIQQPGKKATDSLIGMSNFNFKGISNKKVNINLQSDGSDVETPRVIDLESPNSKNDQFNDSRGRQRHRISASVLLSGDLKQKNSLLSSNNDPYMQNKLSIIKDTETINEEDTVQEDGQSVQGIPGNNYKEGFNASTLTQEEQMEMLKQSISKRASMLAAEETSRKSQINGSMIKSADKATKSSLVQNYEINAPVIIETDEKEDEIMKDEESEENEEPQAEEVDEEEFQDAGIRDIKEDDIAREHSQTILQLNENLIDKEKLLQAIKESQKTMQTELLDMMKNQYHQKVLELTREITSLENEKKQNLDGKEGLNQAQRKKIEEKFLTKQKELEEQLKQVKEKNNKQFEVKKQMDSYSGKIRSLESEIQKIKTQKLSAQRKWKEESEKHNKLRKQRAEELLRLKKASLKKDKEIETLKKEAQRKDALNKRKIEEIQVLQVQKKLQDTKKQNAKEMRQQKANIDKSQIEEWIRQSLERMIDIAKCEGQIKEEAQKLKQVDLEMEDECEQKAQLALTLDKLMVQKYMIEGLPEDQQDQEDLFKIDQKIEKIELELDHFDEAIECLNEKQSYIQGKISEFHKEIVQLSTQVAGSLAKQNLNNQEAILTVIESFFTVLKEASINLRSVQNNYDQQVQELEQLKEEYEQQKELLEANEKYYFAKIQTMEHQCQSRELQLESLLDEMKSEQDSTKTTVAPQRQGLTAKVMTAKQEVQKNKESAVNESVMFLKKRVADLEKQVNQLETNIQVVKNQLHANQSEKQQILRKNDMLKSQLKALHELTPDISLKKAIQGTLAQASSLNDQQYNQNSENGQIPRQYVQTGIKTLAERRNELKNFKAAQHREGSSSARAQVLGLEVKSQATEDVQMSEQDDITIPNFTSPKSNIKDSFGESENMRDTDENEIEPIKEDPASELQSQISQVPPIDGRPNSARALNTQMFSQIPKSKQLQGLTRQSSGVISGAGATGTQKGEKIFNYNTNDPKEKLSVPGKRIPVQGNKVRASGFSPTNNLSGNSRHGVTNRQGTAALNELKMKRKSTQIDQLGKFNQPLGPSGLRSPGGAGKISFQHEIKKSASNFALNFNPSAKVSETIISARGSDKGMQRTESQKEIEQQQYNSGSSNRYGWHVAHTIENAHLQQIYDMEVAGNLLFSTSYKTFKVWDLNTMQVISQINNHQGAIKCIKAYEDASGNFGNSIFATAGDKTDKCIHLWDLTTMSFLSTLKGHRGEIRAIEFEKNGRYLFSAGQGGMLVWDLRKTENPLIQIEKTMDIFCLGIANDHLFMGNRNHSIISMGLNSQQSYSEQVKNPVKHPHLDIVTSFTSLHQGKILISSSKDKNIRAWSTSQLKDYSHQVDEEPLVLLKNLSVNKAHQDEINVLAPSFDGFEFYSGSKDGVVKVWSLNDQDETDEQNLVLSQTGQLIGQGGSVSAIVAIEPQYCLGENDQKGKNMIAYGGMDNCIRICSNSP